MHCFLRLEIWFECCTWVLYPVRYIIDINLFKTFRVYTFIFGNFISLRVWLLLPKANIFVVIDRIYMKNIFLIIKHMIRRPYCRSSINGLLWLTASKMTTKNYFSRHFLYMHCEMSLTNKRNFIESSYLRIRHHRTEAWAFKHSTQNVGTYHITCSRADLIETDLKKTPSSHRISSRVFNKLTPLSTSSSSSTT